MAITIYADSNIYRYMATGELEVTTLGSIRFAYSTVHFDEILRSGNTDMLEGMKALGAVRVDCNENGQYDVDSIGVCLDYEDPYKLFDEYKNNIEIEFHEAEENLHELLLRLLGADNYNELQNVPDYLKNLALEQENETSLEAQNFIIKAQDTAKKLDVFIEKDLSKKMPLTETRKAFGFPKGATTSHGNELDPIEGIWMHMQDKVGSSTKDQFFGFEPIPGVELELSRLGSISGCHLVLNMVGFHPDKGLPKKDKIRNILSDGQHLGYGSLCDAFLTSDLKLFKKAEAIFAYRKYITKPMHIPYSSTKMSPIFSDPEVIKHYKIKKDNLVTSGT